MGDPRDRLDAWLHAEVEPLPPPPGTFLRIRRRARRRKAGRAAMSAAGLVVVVAAAVAVPRVAAVLESHSPRPGHPVAAGPSPTVHPPTPSRGTGQETVTSPTPLPSATSSLSATGSSAPVPPNFQPTSVTFVGPHTGVVIGQAGTAGHCPIVAGDCTSLAGTSDYGASWYGVSAPVTSAPDGSQGVGQIRFLNTRDGWAFGPQLWVTHDGGAHWSQEQTRGLRVTDLETAGTRAFAIFARCTGTGPDYAARCSGVSLYSSVADSGTWQPVPGAAGLAPPTSDGATASASLVLTGGSGGTGFLLAPTGELLRGPLTGAAWTVADPVVPCLPGAAGADGQPTGALLAADAGRLDLVCASATSAAADTQAKSVFQSADGGAHWSPAGTAPAAGLAASVAIQAQDNLIVLATDAGLYRSADGGRSWRRAQPSPGDAAAGQPGFSYVGMTSLTNGVALPADPGLHEVFITTDGGTAWQAHAVSSP